MRKRVLEATPEADELGHRLRIQTIDALCASLTRQMPVLARFGAQPELVEDARAALPRSGPAHLEGPLARRPSGCSRTSTTTSAPPRRLLASMLAKRDQWLRKTGAARPTRAELEASSRARARAHPRRTRAALHPKASVEFAQQLPDQRTYTWTKRAASSAGARRAHRALREALEALLQHAARALHRRRSGRCSRRSSSCCRSPPRSSRWCSASAARPTSPRSRKAPCARSAAPKPRPTCCSRSTTRIKHILVDEFQDTSISQWELLDAPDRAAGPRATAARCSWSATRCSRSTASARRRSRSSCRRARRGSAA